MQLPVFKRRTRDDADTLAAPGAVTIACAGLVALAVAMGIGRFAFTPILPMMESDAGLSLKAAGWLAAANYLGYLIGALCAARLSLTQAVRGGLLLISVVTFAMGVTHLLGLQIVLRLLAGVASAWVLVHVSAWTLDRLSTLQRVDISGIVYAGVGIGIAAAGLVVMGSMHVRLDSDGTWQLFGVLSLIVTLVLWPMFGSDGRVQRTTAAAQNTGQQSRVFWNADKYRLMWCYGVFGLGYIVPATFLPTMAHHYVSNPLVFGLAWPVFGAAAALSTWVAARWLAHVNDRRLWALCYLLMATGVALPALWSTLTAILLAALLVGGTFMVVTMLGLREARRVSGADATAFIALMTVAFAVGQTSGPLIVSAVTQLSHGFAVTLLGAAFLLLVSALILWLSAMLAATNRESRVKHA